MKRLLKRLMIAVYHVLCVVIPKDRHLVVLSSENGKGAGGNPRAIFDHAVKDENTRREGYRFVWFLTREYLSVHPDAGSGELCIPGLSRIATYGYPAYYWYMARASFWIFDSRQEPYIRKRKGVRYLQTWHGTPLKKLGLDLQAMNMAGEDRDASGYYAAIKKESSMWDLLIAQNKFSHETFRRCFSYDGEILDIGYPRNDVLVRKARSAGKDPAGDKKTILYAPTWRDDKYLDGGWYAYSGPLDPEMLEKELGDGYNLIIRPHYLVKMRKEDIPESVIRSGFVKVVTGEADINELYLKADVMITDYSSAMFDYSLLHRPMVFFAYDMEEYAGKLRGFYFDFADEAPGPIVKTSREAVESLKKIFEGPDTGDGYNARTEAFRERYNTFDDGNASKKAWEALIEKDG